MLIITLKDFPPTKILRGKTYELALVVDWTVCDGTPEERLLYAKRYSRDMRNKKKMARVIEMIPYPGDRIYGVYTYNKWR